MNKKVIYTSIFGGYDNLFYQEYMPDGFDFVVFTDTDLKSEQWKVRKETPLYEDNTRNAKRFKILPHRFLSNYDVSIYIDGNYVVKNDLNELVDKFLKNSNAAFYDHNQQPEYDKRNCIYKEADVIFQFGKRNGNYKDNPKIIQAQIQKYINEGYPQNNGLINGGIILRTILLGKINLVLVTWMVMTELTNILTL